MRESLVWAGTVSSCGIFASTGHVRHIEELSRQRLLNFGNSPALKKKKVRGVIRTTTAAVGVCTTCTKFTYYNVGEAATAWQLS
jgi:hypothetical protein